MLFSFFFVYLILCEYNEGAKQKGEMVVFLRSKIKQLKKEGKLQEKHRPGDIENNAGSSPDSATTEKKNTR